MSGRARFEAPEAADNDDRMRSLIEVSRETGIPMPRILRLQREHPERLPSVGVGSGQFFPEGVVSELRALAEADGLLGGSGESGGRALLSLSRRRRERDRAPTPPPEPAAPRQQMRQSAEAPTPRAARATEAGTDPLRLAHRLGELERRQRRLAGELAELVLAVQKPRVGRGRPG